MKNHTIKFDDAELIDFSLVAIHTSIEDYRLAFMINKYLSVSLTKFYPDNTKAVSPQDAHKLFASNWCDGRWEILRNKFASESTFRSNDDRLQNIFDQVSTTTYIVPEKKKIDYFLKIHEPEIETLKIAEKISQFPQIVAAFEVDVYSLKSKNNLIY